MGDYIQSKISSEKSNSLSIFTFRLLWLDIGTENVYFVKFHFRLNRFFTVTNIADLANL